MAIVWLEILLRILELSSFYPIRISPGIRRKRASPAHSSPSIPNVMNA
jgi:hypothetical protein